MGVLVQGALELNRLYIPGRVNGQVQNPDKTGIFDDSAPFSTTYCSQLKR